MRKQYNGNQWKLIPKAFDKIPDIGRYMETDKRRLTEGERYKLNQVLAAGRFGYEFGEEYKLAIGPALQAMGMKLLGDGMILRQVKTPNEVYYLAVLNVKKVVLNGENQIGNIEMRIPEKIYRLGEKVDIIQKETITRLL